MLEAILNDKQKENLYNEWELDFSYSIPGLSRFRGNVMFQRNSLGVNFRVIPFEIPEISALGLPAGVEDLCDLSRGLVLVTGPTGSGKSTTLAAMVNYINETKNVNIITLEDPIEFLHNHKKYYSSSKRGRNRYSFFC
jgi:pilus retraction ATPase PilT